MTVSSSGLERTLKNQQKQFMNHSGKFRSQSYLKGFKNQNEQPQKQNNNKEDGSYQNQFFSSMLDQKKNNNSYLNEKKYSEFDLDTIVNRSRLLSNTSNSNKLAKWINKNSTQDLKKTHENYFSNDSKNDMYTLLMRDKLLTKMENEVKEQLKVVRTKVVTNASPNFFSKVKKRKMF